MSNGRQTLCDSLPSKCVSASEYCFWRAPYRRSSSCRSSASGSFERVSGSFASDSQLGPQTVACLAEYRQICWEVWDYISPPLCACSGSRSVEFAVETSFCSSFRSCSRGGTAKRRVRWQSCGGANTTGLTQLSHAPSSASAKMDCFSFCFLVRG